MEFLSLSLYKGQTMTKLADNGRQWLKMAENGRKKVHRGKSVENGFFAEYASFLYYLFIAIKR